MYWKDAICLEVKNVHVAFSDLDENERVPVGYQQIICHMIFDVKVGSLQQKARHVAGGHTTDAPSAMTYASVVSREFIWAADSNIEWPVNLGSRYIECVSDQSLG
jgi:hypothetical protein